MMCQRSGIAIALAGAIELRCGRVMASQRVLVSARYGDACRHKTNKPRVAYARRTVFSRALIIKFCASQKTDSRAANASYNRASDVSDTLSPNPRLLGSPEV